MWKLIILYSAPVAIQAFYLPGINCFSTNTSRINYIKLIREVSKLKLFPE